MNISELIRELEKLQQECGDIEVRLQCQDQGGVYEGTVEVTGAVVDFCEYETAEESKSSVVIY